MRNKSEMLNDGASAFIRAGYRGIMIRQQTARAVGGFAKGNHASKVELLTHYPRKPFGNRNGDIRVQSTSSISRISGARRMSEEYALRWRAILCSWWCALSLLITPTFSLDLLFEDVRVLGRRINAHQDPFQKKRIIVEQFASLARLAM